MTPSGNPPEIRAAVYGPLQDMYLCTAEYFDHFSWMEHFTTFFFFNYEADIVYDTKALAFNLSLWYCCILSVKVH